MVIFTFSVIPIALLILFTYYPFLVNGTATYFIKMHEMAHVYKKVGLACAMAVVRVLIICVCTVIQKLIFKYAFRNATTNSKEAK